MDNESRIISAVQLHKAFDLLLSQPSAMVTSQHRENPQHNNQETCALHLRESALHMAKHLSRGIKRVSCSILRQSCQNAYKLLLLGNEDFISSAKLCVFSSNWSPPSVPTESIQGTPILENQGCLLNGIQRNGVLTRAWDILVLPTHKPTTTFLHKDIWSPHVKANPSETTGCIRHSITGSDNCDQSLGCLHWTSSKESHPFLLLGSLR